MAISSLHKLLVLAAALLPSAVANEQPTAPYIETLPGCAFEDLHNGKCSNDIAIFPVDDYYTSPQYSDGGIMVLEFKRPYTMKIQNLDTDHPAQLAWRLAWSGPRISKNLSKGQDTVDFTFKDLAAGFPTAEHNITPAVAERLAGSASNLFLLSQPGGGHPASFGSYPRPDLFAVFDNVTYDYFDGAMKRLRSKTRDDEYDKWKLPVGIAVGIGVPCLMVGTFLLGWMFGMRKRKRVGYEKNIELSEN